jgi:hypothetical protein
MTEPRQTEPQRYTPPIYTEADFDFVDAGIRREVTILSQHGIETFESCEGGPGHAFPEPTIRFFGGRDQGFKALHIALQYNLRPASLRRYYSIIDGEPVGPEWEMTFWSKGL